MQGELRARRQKNMEAWRFLERNRRTGQGKSLDSNGWHLSREHDWVRGRTPGARIRPDDGKRWIKDGRARTPPA